MKANYAVSYESGTLTVTPRALRITTPNKDAYYTGRGLTCTENYAQEGLLPGHRIRVTASTELVKAGRVPNEFEIAIDRVDDGTPVASGNYTVTYTYGYLEVRPARIPVRTPNQRREYNGTPFSYTNMVISGIPADHRWEPKEGTVPSITNVGSIQNEFEICIYNAAGEDVTESCFVLNYQYGTLTVDKRSITVTSDNEEDPFIYDGTAQSYSREKFLASTTLPAGHSMVLTTLGSITLPTEQGVNRVLDAVVLDAEGNDVTFNFDITLQDGTLYMDPRPITVKPEDAEKEYDGRPLTCSIPVVSSQYDFPLVEGHTITIVTNGSQTEINSIPAPNEIVSWEIRDAAGNIVNDYYSVTLEPGTLTVTRHKISIKTKGATKVYDGTPLSCPEFEILSGQLAENHRLVLIGDPVQLVDVGQQSNLLEFMVVDENGDDVTDIGYVLVREDVGMLEITPRPITLETPSAAKSFDGQPLMSPGLSVAVGDLAAGHLLSPNEDFSSITAPGMIDNTCTFTITDENGNDVMGNYEVEVEWGTLEVRSDGYLDESGELTKDPLPEMDMNEENTIRVFGSASGTVYLRFKSFGDYTGLGFSSVSDPYVFSDGMSNPQTWMSAILQQAGYQEASLKVELPKMQYLSPYYLMTGGLRGDDTQFHEIQQEYEVLYVPGTMTDALMRPESLPADMAEDELLYREYVYAQYLQVPDYMSIQLWETIEKNRLRGDSFRQTVYNVANYVSRLIPYDQNFDSIPAEQQDIVSYFLTEMDSAICQHYAAAATMLYRALGIPARYCVGYVAETVENEWTEIGPESAHAWVEIYVDGKGWIPVEVTNGYATEVRDRLEFKPYDIRVTYDGKAHGPVAGQFWETTGTLPTGYSVVDVVFEGAQVDAGYYTTRIRSLRILDPYGNDVTETFDISYASADLIIDAIEIVVQTGSCQVSFDGMEHGNTEWSVVSGTLADGHVLEAAVTMTLRDPGERENLLEYLTITDKHGNVVFHGTAGYDEYGNKFDTITGQQGNYVIVAEYGTLTVTWK